MGLSGDRVTDGIYYHLKNTLFRNTPCAYFKHLSGEYDTSSSFALYLASGIIKEQKLPEIIRLGWQTNRKIRKILIYNHLRNSHIQWFSFHHAEYQKIIIAFLLLMASAIIFDHYLHIGIWPYIFIIITLIGFLAYGSINISSDYYCRYFVMQILMKRKLRLPLMTGR